MNLADIRRYYKVPAFRDASVKALQRTGTITGSASAYIRVWLYGEKRSKIYHLTWWMEYVTIS